jgi:hypothetical protein
LNDSHRQREFLEPHRSSNNRSGGTDHPWSWTGRHCDRAGTPASSRAQAAALIGYSQEVTDEPAPWVEPSDLVRVRAQLEVVQGRIDRANRQLQLSAQLTARMQALLQAPAASELLPASPSPARQAAELEATQILLQAELRAGEIISGAPPPGPAANGPAALEVRPEVAQVVEERIWAFADVEGRLVELASKALQQEAGTAARRRGRSASSGRQSGRSRRSSPAPANPDLANPVPANADLANPAEANPAPANPAPANPVLANPGRANPGRANSGRANSGRANSEPGPPKPPRAQGRSSRSAKKNGLRGVGAEPVEPQGPPDGADRE